MPIISLESHDHMRQLVPPPRHHSAVHFMDEEIKAWEKWVIAQVHAAKFKQVWKYNPPIYIAAPPADP